MRWCCFVNLGGDASEEVFCQSERVSQDGNALVALLLWRFGPPETVHSLNRCTNATGK